MRESTGESRKHKDLKLQIKITHRSSQLNMKLCLNKTDFQTKMWWKIIFHCFCLAYQHNLKLVYSFKSILLTQNEVEPYQGWNFLTTVTGAPLNYWEVTFFTFMLFFFFHTDIPKPHFHTLSNTISRDNSHLFKLNNK